MARKSAASLSIVPNAGKTGPPEPAGLIAEELTLWREIVATKPVDWFQADSAPLLKEYVRAACLCDRLDAQIKEEIAVGGVDEVKFYIDLRDKESRRAMSLATKMRLTQQSRYDTQKAAVADRRVSGRRPWE